MSNESKVSSGEKNIILFYLLLAAFLIRLILTPYFTHNYDMGTWKFWANQIVAIGFPGFFDKVSWSDYLPSYFYALFAIEKINQTFHTSSDLIFKIPAILSDIGSGLLIYLIAKQLSFNKRIILASAYLFNPAIFANSAMWGQVDGIGAFLMLLSIYLFFEKRFILLGIAVAIAILFKPLYLIAVPVFGIPMLKSHFKKIPVLAISFLISAFLIAAPFSENFLYTPKLILDRYSSSLGQYHYASVNGFNYWAMVGENWKSDEQTFLGVTYNFWGLIIFIGIYTAVCLCFLLSHKTQRPNYLLIFSLLVVFLAVFTFPTKVHERHMLTVFPFLALLLYHSRAFIFSYIILSVIYLLNLYFGIYYLYLNGQFVFSDNTVTLISAGEVAVCLFLFAYYLSENLWLKKH